MHHFGYRGGVLHAEDISLPDIAHAVGTPFYCYSTATLERHYRVLQQAFAGLDHPHLLRHQGQLQPGGHCHAGAPGRRHGRGVGRRTAPRPGGRRARRSHHLCRRGQDPRGNGLRAGGGHPRLQRRVRTRAGCPERSRRRARPHSAHCFAHQPRCRRQDARQDLHRQGRKQVRRPLWRCTTPLCEGRHASRVEGRRHPHAHRQPDHRPRAVPRCVHADAGAGGRPASRRPRHRAPRHGRRPRRAVPLAATTFRRRHRPMPTWCARR